MNPEKRVEVWNKYYEVGTLVKIWANDADNTKIVPTESAAFIDAGGQPRIKIMGKSWSLEFVHAEDGMIIGGYRFVSGYRFKSPELRDIYWVAYNGGLSQPHQLALMAMLAEGEHQIKITRDDKGNWQEWNYPSARKALKRARELGYEIKTTYGTTTMRKGKDFYNVYSYFEL